MLVDLHGHAPRLSIDGQLQALPLPHIGGQEGTQGPAIPLQMGMHIQASGLQCFFNSWQIGLLNFFKDALLQGLGSQILQLGPLSGDEAICKGLGLGPIKGLHGIEHRVVHLLGGINGHIFHIAGAAIFSVAAITKDLAAHTALHHLIGQIIGS